MADVSKIKVPNGTVYDIKDETARAGLAGKAEVSHTHTAYALKSKYGDTTIDVGRKTGTDVGICSDAEGWHTTASGDYSHSEGLATTASNRCSHSEGVSTVASGESSHAEGTGAIALGDHSHARGWNTIANNSCETASGKYNVSNSDTLFSIGDGTADDARHNAFEITTTGGKLHDKDIATLDDIPTTPIKSTGWTTTPTNGNGEIYLPEGNSRKYISFCSQGSFSFMFHTGSTYVVQIRDGNMAILQSTPITYIAFYID